MEHHKGDPARRRRRASSPDSESLPGGLGLDLGFAVQSNASTSNTIDGARSQSQAGDNYANASMSDISAPRSANTSTFSSMGPRPANSLIGATATRAMFGRSISIGNRTATPRSNARMSSASSNTLMEGVQSHGQAGARQPRTSASSRARASVLTSTSATSNTPVGARTTMGTYGTVTSLPAAAPANANPVGTGFPAVAPANTGFSNAVMSASTTGLLGATTSTGLLSAASINNPSTAVPNLINSANALLANLPPNITAAYNQLLNLASSTSTSAAQLRNQLNQMHAVLSRHPIHNRQHIFRALVQNVRQVRQRVNASSRFIPRPVLPTPATTFHQFPLLPKELQLKIWKLMVPGPRIIELKTQTIRTALDEESEVTYNRCVSQASDPVLLRVCRDSRYLAKKIYKLCFEEELKWPVYMDPSRDILLLPDTIALDVFASAAPRSNPSTPPSLAQIKYIVIDPKGVFSSLHARPTPRQEILYPAYRFEEIAATYGSLKEIVVLKYPANHHLAPLPPQLNQAGVLGRSETMGVENHIRMLLQWSLTNRARITGAPAPPFVNPFPGGFPQPPVALPFPATWNQPQVQVGLPYVGPGPNGGPITWQQLRAPWPIPDVVAMTLDELKARMERDELEQECNKANDVAQ